MTTPQTGPARRRIGINVLWKTLAEASRGFQIVYFVLLARWLGAESFGRFSVGFAAAMFLASLGDCGLNVLLTRDVAGDKSKGAPLFLQITYAKVPIFAVALAAVVLWPGFAAERRLVLIFLTVAIGRNILDQLSYFCLAYERLQVESWMKLILGCATLGLGLAALLLRPGVGSAAAALAGAEFIAASFGLILIARQVAAFPHPSLWPAPAWPKSGKSDVASLALINLALAGFSRIDIACLKWLQVTAAETGRYFAAERIIAGIGLLPGFVAIAALPVFSDLGSREAQSAARKLRLELLGAGGLVALGTAAVSGLATRLVYGAAYEGMARYLACLSLAVPFMFINHFSLTALIGAKRSWSAATAACAAIAINGLLDLSLIPRLGAIGAALAAVGGQFVLSAACWPLLTGVAPEPVAF